MKNDQIIGCIIGCIRTVVINQQEYNCIDIDFLCIDKNHRNLKLTSFLVDLIRIESVKNNCTIGICTMSNPIHKYNNFHICCKNIYHYPVLQNVKNSNLKFIFINGDYSSEIDITKLHKNLNSFLQKKFLIYDKKSNDELNLMLTNNAFYHFIFDDGSYFCFYKLDLMNFSKLERHFYLYTFILNDPSALKNYLSPISNHCKSRNLCDFISLIDPFGISHSDYLNLGFLKGSSSLNFYLYNYSSLCSFSSKDIHFVPI